MTEPFRAAQTLVEAVRDGNLSAARAALEAFSKPGRVEHVSDPTYPDLSDPLRSVAGYLEAQSVKYSSSRIILVPLSTGSFAVYDPTYSLYAIVPPETSVAEAAAIVPEPRKPVARAASPRSTPAPIPPIDFDL